MPGKSKSIAVFAYREHPEQEGYFVIHSEIQGGTNFVTKKIVQHPEEVLSNIGIPSYDKCVVIGFDDFFEKGLDRSLPNFVENDVEFDNLFNGVRVEGQINLA